MLRSVLSRIVLRPQEAGLRRLRVSSLQRLLKQADAFPLLQLLGFVRTGELYILPEAVQTQPFSPQYIFKKSWHNQYCIIFCQNHQSGELKHIVFQGLARSYANGSARIIWIRECMAAV